MKPLKKQKLTLKSETVAIVLDDAALGQVVGGSGFCAPVQCTKLYSGCRSGGTSDCNVSQVCGGSFVCGGGFPSNGIC